MKKFMVFFLLAAIGAVGVIGRADAAPKMGGGMQNHSSVGIRNPHQAPACASVKTSPICKVISGY